MQQRHVLWHVLKESCIVLFFTGLVPHCHASYSSGPVGRAHRSEPWIEVSNSGAHEEMVFGQRARWFAKEDRLKARKMHIQQSQWLTIES